MVCRALFAFEIMNIPIVDLTLSDAIPHAWVVLIGIEDDRPGDFLGMYQTKEAALQRAAAVRPEYQNGPLGYVRVERSPIQANAAESPKDQ